MVRNVKEIPITYLNKGHTYNILVQDSNPPTINPEPIRYRTSLRVSFEEEQQRIDAPRCWQLWKEGRGTNEARQRGGKLLAVEYVDTFKDGGEIHQNGQVQVENMSVDGFCVTWTANPATGTSGCKIPVRFNFLSTDFSHSKGVKGSPVRLCAKTEILSTGEELGVTHVELAYCNVKLFRDHGAERKISNDTKQVQKTIDKLKQQVSEAEIGGGFVKRKRGNKASATVKGINRPMKQSKYKRTLSMASDDGLTENISLRDDLQSKLAIMQEMFSSARSVSVFGLRGDQTDDPDIYPIRLSGAIEAIQPEDMSSQNTGDLWSAEAMIPSPANSNSFNSPPLTSTKLTKRPIPVQRIPTADQVSRGFLEAVGIDSNYRTPLKSRPKPIACFYVRFRATEKFPEDYYCAVYLSERTSRDLIKQICAKQQIDPVCIVRMIHVNEHGMRILVDDHVVCELPEGQDMVVDISEASGADGNNVMEIISTY